MSAEKVPDIGLRGGLGRTLLTAFLVLAILPLSAVSWYATSRSRLNIQHEVMDKLASVATSKEAQIVRWVEEQRAALSSLDIRSCLTAGSTAVCSCLAGVAAQWGDVDLALLNARGQVQCASAPGWEGDVLALPADAESPRLSLIYRRNPGIVLVVPLDDPRWPYIAMRVPPDALSRMLAETAGLGQTGRVYVVDRLGMAFPQGRQVSSSVIDAALSGGEGGVGLYSDYEGTPVIGAYRWLPEAEMALFVEQSQQEAFASNDALVTALVAFALGVAMLTAVSAAFVARQITRPVVQLTESALRIAAGDLSQKVEVNSRDEIGILAHVFNRMSAELAVLYSDLEAKVAQRTELLQRANYLIQRRAIQMQASLEVGRAITSIRDPDLLLKRVVEVVRERFVYSHVVVYTVNGEELTLAASAGQPISVHGDAALAAVAGPIGRAFRERQPVVESYPLTVTVGPTASYTHCEVALPLLWGGRVLGVLGVQSLEEHEFDHDEVSVLQNVAQQVAAALENARAYAVEREAVQRLKELDQSKRRFLSNMSRELRTPLTNILGFSQLMLKEIDAPLTPRQREDLQIILQNGRHLLGLINDLLDLSQIEAGLMELEFRQIDLADLVHSVMVTTSALVRGRSIALREEIAPDLPLVQADPARIRQVLLGLLSNAARFTETGEIRVRAWADADWIYVSISDTGIGIPPEDHERIFERFEQGTLENGRRPEGAGLGLALSKEFVEMHGGRIWVESQVGQGSTFTFSLPLRPLAQDRPAGKE